MKCYNPEACLGMIPPDYNPIGDCAEEYQGVLCADCKPNYRRDIDYVCHECPDRKLTITKIFFVILAILVLALLLIKVTFDAEE